MYIEHTVCYTLCPSVQTLHTCKNISAETFHRKTFHRTVTTAQNYNGMERKQNGNEMQMDGHVSNVVCMYVHMYYIKGTGTILLSLCIWYGYATNTHVRP